MTDVGVEAVLRRHRIDQVRGHFGLDLGHALTVPADEVDVVRLGRRMVRGGSVTQVGVTDQSELLEQVQRAVDGGDVDALRGLPDLGQDLFGRRVVEVLDGLEYEFALRRQP